MRRRPRRSRCWRSSRCRSGCRSRPTGRTVNLLIPALPGRGRGHARATCCRGCSAAPAVDGRARAGRRPRRGGRSHGPRRAASNGCCSPRSCCTRCRRSTRPTTRRPRRTSRSSTSRSAAVRAAARCALDARAAARLPRRGRRAGGRVRGDRLRRVLPQDAVPEPEGGRGEPVRQLLPGQLAVLRPEHLRALPGARDARASRPSSCGARRRRDVLLGAACSRGCSAGS